MTQRLTPDEIFREFAMTDSPFEKWPFFSHIRDEATLIYLPNQKQRFLCNILFGIAELIRSGDEKKKKEGMDIFNWLAGHQEIVKKNFGSASPAFFYSLMKNMTPDEIEQVTSNNGGIFLLFNPRKLSFAGSSTNKLASLLNIWRKK